MTAAMTRSRICVNFGCDNTSTQYFASLQTGGAESVALALIAPYHHTSVSTYEQPDRLQLPKRPAMGSPPQAHVV